MRTRHFIYSMNPSVDILCFVPNKAMGYTNGNKRPAYIITIMEQKTVSSIKTWAIVLGILSLFSLWTLSFYSVASVEGFLALIGLILGLAALWAGVQIATVSLATASGIFWAKFVLLVIDFLLFLSARHISFIGLVVVVAEGIVTWYLIASVKKLHRA